MSEWCADYVADKYECYQVNLCIFAVERDYCEGEKFRPSCLHDEVISMSKAVYGRMKLGRCIKLDMGHLGCNDDVLDLADDMCSGRRNCEILIPDQTFESTKPCLELKSYLQASYTCIKGLSNFNNQH